MADYESRIVRGWRGRLEDLIAEARERVWSAPAETAYLEGKKAPMREQQYGYQLWFKRVYGPEREVASNELQQLRRIKQKKDWGERTEDAKERKRVKDHERYLRRKAEETPEARNKRQEAQSARRARRTPDQIEHDRAWFRQWRAKKSNSEEWQCLQAEKKRQRRAARPDLYDEIDRRSREKNRDAINERRRRAYREDPEKELARCRAYRAAKADRIREQAGAQCVSLSDAGNPAPDRRQPLAAEPVRTPAQQAKRPRRPPG